MPLSIDMNRRNLLVNAIFLPIIIALCISSGCSNAQFMSSKKILIVYLSRTNNTKAIEEIIQKNVGGTLVALELEKRYPENYKATVQQVVKENEAGYLPTLKTKIDSIQNYDVVFVGFPTWDMQMPPPMKSFLHQYDLSGKTVIPFNTNAGYGVRSGFQTVKELCPNSKILEGFEIKGGVERDGVYFVIKGEKAKEAETEVKKWLGRIKIIE
jgi:flavodoxin